MNTSPLNAGAVACCTLKGVQQQNSTVAQQLRNNNATARATEKYEQALDRITDTLRTTGSGCHSAIMAAANIGVLTGQTPDRVQADIRAVATGSRRQVQDSEIRDAVDKAVRECVPAATGSPRPAVRPVRPVAPPFDGMAYRKKLIAQGDGAEEMDFMELSGGTLPGEPSEDAAYLLTMLYKPSDVLYTGDVYGTKVDTVQAILERVRGGSIPPHIIPNPMTGDAVETTTGKRSYRCDAAVSQYRFAVVEFDDLDRASQLAFWHSIITRKLLNVACLIDSGKKSIHAWIEVACRDAQEWRLVVRDGLYHPITGRMAAMGADRACQNPARLSRLPGHQREGGRMQQLVYMNPKLQEASQ
jgi:hypothetical protein